MVFRARVRKHEKCRAQVFLPSLPTPLLLTLLGTLCTPMGPLKLHHMQTDAPCLSLGPREGILAEKRPTQTLEVGREFSGPGYSECGLGDGRDSGLAHPCWPCRLFAQWSGGSISGRGQCEAFLPGSENDTEWGGVPSGRRHIQYKQ